MQRFAFVLICPITESSQHPAVSATRSTKFFFFNAARHEDFQPSCRTETMCHYRSLLVSIQAFNGGLEPVDFTDSNT